VRVGVIFVIGHAVAYTTGGVADVAIVPVMAPRRLLAPAAGVTQQSQASGGTIKQCLWSDSTGCALNPSFMFTVDAKPDSYERCAAAQAACTLQVVKPDGIAVNCLHARRCYNCVARKTHHCIHCLEIAQGAAPGHCHALRVLGARERVRVLC
jgi:hypothetical protein